MAWLYLLAAAALEVVWAVGLKWSDGFTRWRPSVLTVAALAGSFVLLERAVRLGTVPLGTAYAVWTGLGAAGTAAVGVAVFGEPLTWARVGCVGLIVGGVAGLRLTAGP